MISHQFAQRGQHLNPDRELIDQVVDSDPEAADLFVLRFSRFVWAILVRSFRLKDAEAQEIYQDVFLRLWEDDYRRLRLWSGQGDFVSYLGPIVRHLALDMLRAQGRRLPLEGREEEREEEPRATEPSPEELVVVRERRALLERALEGLAGRNRELYRLRFERERSYKEIAEALGLTVNHVGVALKRLEKRLGRLVKDLDRAAVREKRREEVRS